MRTSYWVSFLLILIAALFAACAPGATSPATPTPTRPPITDYAALVQVFKAERAAVSPGEELSDPLFSVKERLLDLPRARVHVLEYPAEADARAEAARISPNGYQVGNAFVDWVDSPHFYRTNRLIVLYVGHDKTTLGLLERVLGRQFAGAPPDQPTPTIVHAPTAPPPTSGPMATPDPRTPTMVPPAVAQATIAARATASPFPTPETDTRVSGYPAGAGVERRGLWLLVDLSKNTFLAGEGGRARITLRNDSTETIWINGDGSQPAQVILLDEQGHEAPPYPWYSAPQPGMSYLAPLAPGAVITSTVTFHAPPTAPASAHHYVLWAWTRFSRAAPENGKGPDNLWLRLEAGPIPLLISMPNPSQQLNAQLEADRGGWRVKVTDGKGQVPGVPMWGMMEASTYGGFQGGPLKERADGKWSGTWPDYMAGNEITVRVWVSAPGYVTAITSVAVPGNRSGQSMFDAHLPPRAIFPSLDAARATMNLPIATPKELPPGTTLDRVEVEDSTYDGQRRTFVWQVYRSADDNWLELTEMNWTEQFESAGWGQARYNPEAQQVPVSGSTGYLVEQFGWSVLDWKIGAVGFELRAPAGAISREELLQIASHVQP